MGKNREVFSILRSEARGVALCGVHLAAITLILIVVPLHPPFFFFFSLVCVLISEQRGTKLKVRRAWDPGSFKGQGSLPTCTHSPVYHVGDLLMSTTQEPASL